MTITFLPVNMNAQYEVARKSATPKKDVQVLLKKASEDQNTRIMRITAACMATFFTGMFTLSRLLPYPAITFSVSLISSLALSILLEKKLKPDQFEIIFPPPPPELTISPE